VTGCWGAGVRSLCCCLVRVRVGNGRPSCVELTDLQSLSLPVSRDPAVGGGGATGSVVQSCRVAELQSAGVPECGSDGVPEYGGAGLVLLPGSGCLSGTAGRPVSNSLTYRVCRCWCPGNPLSAAAAQRARWVQSAGVTELQSAGVRE
jgi:hypothetical protein